MTSDQDKEEILELIQQITNQVLSELPSIASRYVMTLDILDFIELTRDEEVTRMKQTVEPYPKSIEMFYREAYQALLSNPKYKNNSLIHYIKARIVNDNQINQCIHARGFPSEVTGIIYSTPIMSCYTTGLYKLYDYVAESRGSSKHLYAAEEPLQSAEYFARRLQLIGLVIQGISEKDCGTTRYLTWTIKPPVVTDRGHQIYGGDLSLMIGKFYLDEATGTLKNITGHEKHLYGKTIKLRSVIYCQERDPHKVCPTCFGLLSHNVSRFATLGHLCDATLTQKTTSSILSTKHYIGSAVGEEILLKEDARRYMFFKDMALYMKPMNKTSSYKMIVNRGSALSLTDLNLIRDIDKINMRRISSLSNIVIQEMVSGAIHPVETEIKIEKNKRYGYFSYEFIKYLKDKGWTTNEYDHFVFDLSEWNCKNPIIRIPDMEYSYHDHINQIETIIESRIKKFNSRAVPETPEHVLSDLFDIVNSKISVNLALLEVMVYAVMTPSANDYGLARNVDNPIVNVARNIIVNRSLAPAYAYEYQFNTITNPRSFLMQNRPSSPLDVFIAPREVVQHLESQNPTIKKNE
ncbi:MAG TPA: hypothetical protein VN843_01495 [Anaerolineales bacterium]|nr:hypothetical protein [Anaerolineales bacterium]